MRQYLWLFEEHDVLEFLVLAGDHLYRMDYEKFIQAHRETDADITVAALPMDEKRATAFGLMKIDEEGRITEFAEKPKGEQLKAMRVKLQTSLALAVFFNVSTILSTYIFFLKKSLFLLHEYARLTPQFSVLMMREQRKCPTLQVWGSMFSVRTS